MRKTSSVFRLALYATCVLSLAGFRAYGQEKEQVREQGRDQGNEQIEGKVQSRPNGIVHDWSRRYAVYPRVGPLNRLIALQHDSRALSSWQESARNEWRHWRYPRPLHTPKTGFHTDWNIPLSVSTSNVIPAAMFPAKYGFDPTAATSCPNDFIAFPVNAGLAVAPITGTLTNTSTTVTITAGTITTAYVGQPISGTGIPVGDTVASVTGGPPATSLTLSIAATATGPEALTVSGQPNLVIFNNLYSGTTPVAGSCNRTPSGTDDGVSATVFASYFLNGVGGQVSTSPALSPDGSKLAVVQTAPGQRALFEVLAIHEGDGVDPTNAQNVLLPVSPNFTTAPPGPGNVEAIAMGADPDTNSSPFIQYDTDEAYIGNDTGKLFRVINVFCTSAACITNRPEMSLDPAWGTAGVLTVGGTCTGMVTGPVVDGFGNVFVGCADGKLYGFTSAGVALTGSPIVVGDGSATGGIVDPPVADIVNGFLYVASGNNGSNSVVAQIQISGTTMSLTNTATLDSTTTGLGPNFNLHAPAFNNAYFNGGTALLYEISPNIPGQTTVWGIGFNVSHVMTAGTPANSVNIPENAFESSPITEFFNGTEDFIFESNLDPTGADAFVVNYNVAAGFPSTSTPIAAVDEGGGTTGIVVDNDSADPQASSVYFGVLSAPSGAHPNSAVKLTQSGLQ